MSHSTGSGRCGIQGGAQIIRILVNGDKVDVASHRLTNILEKLGYQCNKVVVAVNQEFVEKESWSHYRVQEGDSLDVLSPIEGG
ncbi:MAG: sulfur carrier protein ThiS [Gammaproteobacteria bacterium]|nr:sulfur carrier protein ThiS [Gammaproteobacteria bacterium]MYD80873.1 sulfur carrier protein ThiS [Gammaproteobacteria bacterium]